MLMWFFFAGDLYGIKSVLAIFVAIQSVIIGSGYN